VVGEEEVAESLKLPPSVPYLLVPNSRIALAQISSRFFEEPTRELPVVGVTGTNGKTTITYLVEAILEAAGRSPAVLGTINYRHRNRVFPASHTTPESYDLQKFIGQVKSEGADSIVMEVSSHALDLHRVSGIQFTWGFANLTLSTSPHGIFRVISNQRRFRWCYESCKKTNRPSTGRSLGEAPGLRIWRPIAYSIDPAFRADIFPKSYRLSLEGIEVKRRAMIRGAARAFNLSNLLAALGVGGGLGVPLETIGTALQKFNRVPGRLDRVTNSKGLHVFVDYAHTPDALKNVLQALRTLVGATPASPRRSRVLVVFGCGGDRDKTKRALMGKVVARLADQAVVTSDNPRTEDPQGILDQILPGLVSEGWQEGREFSVVVDRHEGIRRALEQAREGDIVLIAGKGHEDYQIVGKTKIHFDDGEEVRRFLGP
jgi:UDP-N-acetylmuramoyl-L-alanyl-D-glutamate--2,6-diaminopimelate ligase